MNTKTLFVGLIPLAAALAPSLASADVNQPQEIINRPLTTPGSQLTLGGALAFGLSPEAFDGVSLQVGGSFGANDKLEVGADYAFALKEFEAKGDLNVHAAYSLLRDEKLEVAADVGLGYNVLAEGIDPIGLGARVRFKINDKIAVYTPGQQLRIGLADETGKGMALGIPVGVAFQATPQIYAHIDTSIANIALNDEAGDTIVFGADYIPLQIGAYFSPSNTLDIGADLLFLDLKSEGDQFIAGIVSARLHM